MPDDPPPIIPFPSQGTPPVIYAPVILCRIIGHKWLQEVCDEKAEPGFRIINRHELKGCRRCGIPNPNYEP